MRRETGLESTSGFEITRTTKLLEILQRGFRGLAHEYVSAGDARTALSTDTLSPKPMFLYSSADTKDVRSDCRIRETRKGSARASTSVRDTGSSDVSGATAFTASVEKTPSSLTASQRTVPKGAGHRTSATRKATGTVAPHRDKTNRQVRSWTRKNRHAVGTQDATTGRDSRHKPHACAPGTCACACAVLQSCMCRVGALCCAALRSVPRRSCIHYFILFRKRNGPQTGSRRHHSTAVTAHGVTTTLTGGLVSVKQNLCVHPSQGTQRDFHVGVLLCQTTPARRHHQQHWRDFPRQCPLVPPSKPS